MATTRLLQRHRPDYHPGGSSAASSRRYREHPKGRQRQLRRSAKKRVISQQKIL